MNISRFGADFENKWISDRESVTNFKLDPQQTSDYGSWMFLQDCTDFIIYLNLTFSAGFQDQKLQHTLTCMASSSSTCFTQLPPMSG